MIWKYQSCFQRINPQGKLKRNFLDHARLCPVSKQRVDRPKMGGAHNATEDEFVMHGVPRCLDNQGEKPQGVGLSGERVESLPRKVTIFPMFMVVGCLVFYLLIRPIPKIQDTKIVRPTQNHISGAMKPTSLPTL